ncbi:helix-turn-helix domain-containing protein [Yersinia proxima]|uniref:helix-turn-helix domain-containing protein n=1 Tax=Yersinia proxima TaxID=2890316 RepID=UPI001D1053EE|nr:helix-turn-helix transcriptional regulator [Yersinia proxima]
MNLIAKKRKELNVSQQQMARHLGWGQSRIANYELGIRIPSLEVCRDVVSALNHFGGQYELSDIFPPKKRG